MAELTKDSMEGEIWGIKVRHGEKSKIPIIDNAYTILTNVCLGELLSNEPTSVSIEVETIELEKFDETTNEAPTTSSSFLLGVLTPNKIEHMQISQQYSPLDTVTVTANGPNDIYISGNYIAIDDDEEEEEEEEEEIDENSIPLDENKLTETLMNVVIPDEEKK